MIGITSYMLNKDVEGQPIAMGPTNHQPTMPGEDLTFNICGPIYDI